MSTYPFSYPLQIGAVLFDDFELLDLCGPLELLGMLEDKIQFQLIAPHAGPIRSHQGPQLVAEKSFAQLESDGQNWDILLVPGGMGTRQLVNDTTFLEHLKKLVEQAKIVASVCTGSALLAKTGLLDGKRATSNKLALPWVRSQSAKVEWISQARWVEDGKFFTSSGVSAGMDMTLGLISHLFGRDEALQAARYAEYHWQEDKSFCL